MTKEESLTIDLFEIINKDRGVGSKAANLGKLIKDKFPIPDGFVVKTIAYDLYLSNNSLKKLIQKSLNSIDYNKAESVKNAANYISDLFERSSFPKQLIEEIKLKYQAFSSFNVAIRSSATAEDLPKFSFAGQYDTYLNVKGLELILHYIKKCYASLWTNRAIIYRYKNKIPHDKVKIAVIIQEMVQSKSAGVLFTLNPITSDNKELLIESNFGLGESIVSGKCSPDQFFIKKSKRGSFKILNKRIGIKGLVAYPKSSEDKIGIEYKELSDESNQQPSLSENEILKLAKIGLEIEKKFNGNPQDIEWAIDQEDNIKILQTRPVTTVREQKKEPEILWSRGYSDDYWNDNVTPLYFGLLGDPITKVVNIELNSIMGYKRMATKLLKLYNAHVYFNLDVIKKKIENEIPKFMRNEDILNYFPEGSGSFGKKTMKKLPFRLIKRIVAELRILFHDPNGSMSKTAEAYDKWNHEIFFPYCEEFDRKLGELIKSGELLDFLKLAEDLARRMIAHFRLIRYGIPVHNIGMNLLVQYLLTRFLGKEDCSLFYPILVSGLEHKLTETNEEIYTLTYLINKSPELKSIFINQDSANIYNVLKSETNATVKGFLIKFESF
ncbi:MAG: PEP/pyruvate-binding domain-containing protein, partial [Promethearchaeota archaeon]